jgi:predicted ribosomally synthesized peptide with SipW-like signal peptide
MGDKKRKLLLTLLIVGVLGSLAAFGTYSAFTATTSNDNNSFAAGTVKIEDAGGSATALFNAVTNQAPGVNTQRCIRVLYSGSLASTVHMYLGAAVTNGNKFNVTVERGSGLSTPANRDCTGFSPDAGAAAFATNTFNNFPATYAAGVTGKPADAAWAQTDTIDYRITLAPVDDATPNAHTSAVSTGTFSLTWEARSN